MNGMTLHDAAQAFINALADEHPELQGVTVDAIEERGTRDGWMVFNLTLSNGEQLEFEARPPQH